MTSQQEIKLLTNVELLAQVKITLKIKDGKLTDRDRKSKAYQTAMKIMRMIEAESQE